jgi:hypothetical protein
MVQIVNGASEGSQMEDPVNRPGYSKRFADVLLNKFEARVSGQMSNVFTMARDEIVEAYYLVAFGDQPVTDMRTNESCCSRYDVTHESPISDQSIQLRHHRIISV